MQEPQEPPQLAPELRLEPGELVAPGTLRATGRCPGPASDQPVSPGADVEKALDGVVLWLVGTDVQVTLSLTNSGQFGGSLDVPEGSSPGRHEVRSTCEAADATTSAWLEVLDAPTLDLAPVSGPAGTSVAATGTCRRGGGGGGGEVEVERVPSGPELFMDDARVGTGQLDPATGRWVATVTVPTGAALGDLDVTTDCGGTATFEVLPGADPQQPGSGPDAGTGAGTGGSPVSSSAAEPGGGPGPPDPQQPGIVLVAVPDLADLTEEAAAAALEPQLRLANPTGADGRVAAQDPPAGTEVPEGTPVAVLLKTAATSSVEVHAASSVVASVVLAAAIAVLVLLAAGVAVWRETRRWRDLRWLRGARPRMRLGEWHPTDGPGPPHEGLSLGFDLRRRPAELHFEEAGHARD